MQIHFELYASLMRHLPPDTKRHRADVEIAPDTTPHQVLDRFGVPREQAHLVLLNGVFLHPSQRDEACLSEDDLLAVWPPVAGG
jgi:molybdopterin synthase sulfur carrier subunit